jgi:hypothetical protein
MYYCVSPTREPGQLGVQLFCGFAGRGYESNSPTGRLMALLYWYQAIWYAVHRREVLRRVEVPAAIVSGAMLELFTASASVIAGKVARLRSPYCIREDAPRNIGNQRFSDLIMLGGERFLEEYAPVRRALAALLAASESEERDWVRLVDVAFASHLRRHWYEGAVWSALADEGVIPREDVAVLAAPGIEGEFIPIPIEELAPYIAPLAARGWPAIG